MDGRQPLPNRVTSELLVIREESSACTRLVQDPIVRDGLPIIVCRFVRPRRSEDRRSGIGAQRIVPSTRGKFRKDNLAAPPPAL